MIGAIKVLRIRINLRLIIITTMVTINIIASPSVMLLLRVYNSLPTGIRVSVM